MPAGNMRRGRRPIDHVEEMDCQNSREFGGLYELAQRCARLPGLQIVRALVQDVATIPGPNHPADEVRVQTKAAGLAWE